MITRRYHKFLIAAHLVSGAGGAGLERVEDVMLLSVTACTAYAGSSAYAITGHIGRYRN
ncbi:predicted protein [Brucella abortus bv. 4 str. 292]|uniref:Uncharacterized protein n=1 Tax=Brucella melitensis biotype 2 (strain ATCC 23457) TaxID=546272 RepID=C0RM09_BRUMB|nr:Hypothetical protein, conserved [Brucella melitensis ATCC 23457]EEP61894.1 Hypothetical protein, conserved [Brucella abortus str. 2308 A]EEX57075.1 predicted protein [Brucella abortus bv. 4 str. 292]EEX60298.1 predicted protein [Brucella abortus bv. 2 str. 86/8/59]EEX63318.1 predicted protein [Brucella abortus bv. 6 str. 870]EEX84773.1 predicted protein [Brucella abortus bv. 3 str. Tulya]